MQRVQVGNGQCLAILFVIPVVIDVYGHRYMVICHMVILFVIPVVIDVYGHRFDVFTLVSEIHDNVDLVLGMKNVIELEGVIDMWDSSFKFLNRSIPFFSKEQIILKPYEKKFIKIEAPFIDEISGLAIVKMLDSREQCTVVLKLKFIRNQASLDVTNNTQETVIFDPKEMIGILDLRSLGYYKIRQGALQQNLSKCYHFESADRLCEECNTLVNELKEDKKIQRKVSMVRG